MVKYNPGGEGPFSQVATFQVSARTVHHVLIKDST